MKKNVIASLLAMLAIAGCSGSDVAVESIKISQKTLALEVGQTAALTASVEPADASYTEIEWRSNDPGIASVDAKGVVTAVAAGKTRVLAGSGKPPKYAYCDVTVTAPYTPDPPQPSGSLTKAEAEQARLQVIEDWKKSEKDKVQKIDSEKKVTDIDGHVMKFLIDTYGAEPQGGHSLWISLHGGGATTASENDGQWANQQVMYQRANPKQPAEGVYLSPRAYKDAADMWYFRGNDGLFRQIIETMVIMHGVNPDKVYLMGYSAGGDGVWRMAPRLADHWAAASMMAGHPGSVRFENLRNLPFMMWVGSEDKDYDRNTKVPEASGKIDALQAKDSEGYIHELHVQQGRPHWMELDDAAAFPWMAKYTRNPYPKKIVWRQENEEKKMPEAFFYWLKVADKHITARSDDDAPGSSNERKPYLGKELTASIDGNTITIGKCDYSSFTIYLNDKMVDLDKEVSVVFNGKNLFKGKVDRTLDVLKQTMAERNDPSYVFPAQIIVKVN